MEFGRHLPIPATIFTSLILSFFLFWITGQAEYVNFNAIQSPVVVAPESPSLGGEETSLGVIEMIARAIWSKSPSDNTSINENGFDQVNITSTDITVNENNESLECIVSQRYPERVIRWCELISGEAAQRGIDPDLLAALIWQESGGNPQAYSRDGAVGLMQVMPQDGIAAKFRCPNGPCFQNRPTINQLNNPEFNVKYGTKMLAGLIKRNGSLRDGLRAYGPAGVGYSYADKVISIYRQYRQD